MGNFVARRIQDILVVEDVARDNNERCFCLDSGVGTELVKEGVKDTSVFIFPGSFCISCANMDIREVEDVRDGHSINDIYGFKMNQI